MDILNFISWIKGKRVLKSAPRKSLVAVGVATQKRDDRFVTGAITREDFLDAHLKSTLFAYPFDYVLVPTMKETVNTISGESFFFGNEVTLKSYKISGKIAVGTNFQFWYIGTVSANVPLNGDFPWRVSGSVEAFDDVTGNWLQTGLSDGAMFSDTAGGTVNAEFCTIMEDYNTTPGSIELYLAVGSTSAAGDIYGNVAFEYDIFVDESINLEFTTSL
ncbi:MAG: hypothetical protein RLZZ196_294 [Bacteroidota bacterium]|jgi:hypothetical protein